MAKKKISVAAAKAKGRKFQQWVAEKISQLTGFEYGSSGEDKPIESRPMGQNGVDVRMESQVLKAFPFSVECKRQEAWAIHSWIEQAKQNRIDGTDWLLFCKRSRQDPIVVMDADAFFQILTVKKQAEEGRKGAIKLMGETDIPQEDANSKTNG
jgi:hypothetical protein